MFDGWRDTLTSFEVAAPDLQSGLNVPEAAMSNYEAVATRVADWLPRPLAVVGWSLGGLVAMMAARRMEPSLLVLIEASPSAEVQGFHESVPLAPGTFDPEAAYGPFPPGMRARPESALARAERKRGISVPALPCPALVVFGDAFPDERGTQLAAFYGAEALPLPGLDHWELVLDPGARDAIADRLI